MRQLRRHGLRGLIIADAPLNQLPGERVWPRRCQVLHGNHVVEEEGHGGAIQVKVEIGQQVEFHQAELARFETVKAEHT